MVARSLYICYFGVREPLVQTQVVPYLRELAKGGYDVSLLTFEPALKTSWTNEELRTQKEKLAAIGVEWHHLVYHKNPSLPATVFDVLNGARYIARLARQRPIEILHARAHIPLLMARIARRFTRSKIIFDVRGLVADEYVDAGVWKADSAVYRAIKKLEAIGLRDSDGVVVLTDRLKQYVEDEGLRNGKPIEVIPCCVDLNRASSFRSEKKSERFELVYAGSVVGLYMLEEMGHFFCALKKIRDDAFFRILTTSPRTKVETAFDKLGIGPDDYVVEKAKPAEVVKILERANAAISFRKPTFSQIGASPTKIAEYLAAGLPVVMSYGAGDMDSVISESNTGVIVSDFTEEIYDSATEELIDLATSEDTAARCRETAQHYFDLESVGGERYRRLYARLLEK